MQTISRLAPAYGRPNHPPPGAQTIRLRASRYARGNLNPTDFAPSTRTITMDLDTQAQQLVERLAAKRQTLVLAESCTGGLVASTLATVPGVSAWLAGSLVVYQEASKMRWLGVAEDVLAEHTAVSAPVAHQMVSGALQMTPHADIAASVTGHLGPNAPQGFDGVVFIGVMRRGMAPKIEGVELSSKKRVGRQREAAGAVIEALARALESVSAERA